VHSGNFNDGKAVHEHIIRSGPDFDLEAALPIENALVTMYSKCGKVTVARRIFSEIRKKDVLGMPCCQVFGLRAG